MKLSVIIPTCNRNDLLILCLSRLHSSIQNLSASEYEVIVSDDGKDNQAKELINENFKWVRWVEGPKAGPAANRNNGARHAIGKWLVFLDDDCLPDRSLLLSYSNAVYQYDGILAFEGKITCIEGLRSPLEVAPINLSGGVFWSCNVMIEKKLFMDLHGFDEQFSFAHMEDIEFKERLEKMSLSIVFLPDATVDHPAKRLPFGNKLAKYHESGYFYRKMILKNRFPLMVLFKEILINRIYSIFRYRISLDSVIAFVSLPAELLVTLFLSVGWVTKYSKAKKSQ